MRREEIRIPSTHSYVPRESSESAPFSIDFLPPTTSHSHSQSCVFPFQAKTQKQNQRRNATVTFQQGENCLPACHHNQRHPRIKRLATEQEHPSHATPLQKDQLKMGFKEFLFRGNLIQLAVAVVIGAAFGNVVTALTQGLITPLLAIFGEAPKFSDLMFKVNNAEFRWGWVLDALITFLITALVLYYFVVFPSDWLLSRMEKKVADSTRSCPECCSKMDKKASRCPFCTSAVAPIPPTPTKGGGEGEPMIA